MLAEEGLSTEPSAGCPPGSRHVSAPPDLLCPLPRLSGVLSRVNTSSQHTVPFYPTGSLSRISSSPIESVHLMVSCLNCFRHCVSSHQLDWLSNLRSYWSRGSHKLLVQQVLLDRLLTIASLWQADTECVCNFYFGVYLI